MCLAALLLSSPVVSLTCTFGNSIKHGLNCTMSRRDIVWVAIKRKDNQRSIGTFCEIQLIDEMSTMRSYGTLLIMNDSFYPQGVPTEHNNDFVYLIILF